MTIKVIKEMSNAQLIEKLCQCAKSETNKAFNDGKKIVRELKKRHIINEDDEILHFTNWCLLQIGGCEITM